MINACLALGDAGQFFDVLHQVVVVVFVVNWRDGLGGDFVARTVTVELDLGA